MAGLTDAEVVAMAADAYLYHKAWHKSGRPPCKCPKPSGGDLIDAWLNAQGINSTKRWAELAGEAFEVAENIHIERDG